MAATQRRSGGSSPFPVIVLGVLWFVSTAALVITIMENRHMRDVMEYGHKDHADCLYARDKFQYRSEGGYIEVLDRKDNHIRELEGKLNTYAEATGFKDADELQNAIAPKGGGEGYYGEIAKFEKEIGKEPEGGAPAKNMMEIKKRWQAAALYLKRQAEKATKERDEALEKEKAEKEKSDAEIASLRTQVDEAKQRAEGLAKDVEKVRSQFSEQAAQAEARLKEAQAKYDEDLKEKQDLIDKLQAENKKLAKRPAAAEPGAPATPAAAPGTPLPSATLVTPQEMRGQPDGKIIYVDPDYQFVMIDIGRKDWLALGTVFDVIYYTASDERVVKGAVRVKRVYDEVSQCSILKLDEKEQKGPKPLIVTGDLVSSPIFQRGRRPTFVTDTKFSNARLEVAVERFGGKLIKAESLGTEADYVIESTQSAALVAEAMKRGITIIKEDDLLFYLEAEKVGK